MWGPCWPQVLWDNHQSIKSGFIAESWGGGGSSNERITLYAVLTIPFILLGVWVWMTENIIHSCIQIFLSLYFHEGFHQFLEAGLVELTWSLLPSFQVLTYSLFMIIFLFNLTEYSLWSWNSIVKQPKNLSHLSHMVMFCNARIDSVSLAFHTIFAYVSSLLKLFFFSDLYFCIFKFVCDLSYCQEV